jgi:hypothetical protein
MANQQKQPAGGTPPARPAQALNPQLSPVLSFFREAVLRDRGLQERLRAADSCPAVVKIANEYLLTHFRIQVSSEIEKSPLRGIAEEAFRDAFRVSVEELEQHILYQANRHGEVMLGESELAMVAGSSRLAAGSNCYGCSCGGTC